MSKCKCGSERIISVNAKCSDCCSVQLPNGEEIEGYVPSTLNIGGGDYVQFEFCMDCGMIQAEFPLEVSEGEVIYLIDNGDVFEGTLEEFQDHFFSDATPESIQDWCIEHDYNYRVRREQE